MDTIIIKRLLKESSRNLYHFGFKVMWAKNLCILTGDSLKYVKWKNEVILKYLEKKYKSLIEKYQTMEETLPVCNVKEQPIWVFWWDGILNMPEIIRLCQKSKVNHAGTHSVILLSKDNIRDYVDFPDYVWTQFTENRLKIQHLADMIRVQLIQRYGGIWLDASVFCAKEIPDRFFEVPLYSLKGKDDDYFVSRNQWTTFIIGGQKGNLLCSFLNEFFIEYCKTKKPFIDYFMFDCAIALAYRFIPKVKNELDSLEKAAGDCYWMNDKLYKKWDASLRKEFSEQESVFYKIPWRHSVAEVGKDTFYGYLLERECL